MPFTSNFMAQRKYKSLSTYLSVLLASSCFSWFGLGPLAYIKGKMNATAYYDISDNRVFTTLWLQLGATAFSVST